jgi:TIR domain
MKVPGSSGSMKLRTIYLQSMLSINGRDALSGRVLFDKFKNVSDEVLLGHAIWDDEAHSKLTDSTLRRDLLSYSLVREFQPNVVYIEGGLFANPDGIWKIPQDIADEVCENGGVVIVADVEHNQLYQFKQHYRKAGKFFNVSARYGAGDDENPVYAADEKSFWKGYRQIICKPEKMILSEWLRPIYDGIPGILAGLPVPLNFPESILASCNGDTTGTLHLDVWVDYHDPSPFASVAQNGNGFAVFIAASVSGDVWLEGCPYNTVWLSRIAEFLVDQARQNKARWTSHRRSPHLLFLSHCSTDKAVVRLIASAIKANGVGIWFDEEQLVPSQSLIEEIDRALQSMTHCVLFWSKSCVGAAWVKRELQSTVSRLIEKGIPLFIVRLDETPVPTIIADIFRIEAMALAPEEVGGRIADAVVRLAGARSGLTKSK